MIQLFMKQCAYQRTGDILEKYGDLFLAAPQTGEIWRCASSFASVTDWRNLKIYWRNLEKDW